jgi:DNA (cytosine-5)-methyltransferase 1
MSRQIVKKSQTLEIRLESALAEQLKTVCDSQGVTVSSVLRGLITEYCDSSPVVVRQLTTSNRKQSRTKSLASIISSDETTFRIGEMYCGPGGIALGATQAKLSCGGKTYGFSHSFATDHDADTCQTFARNIRRHSPETTVVCEDIRKLNIESLPNVEGFMFGFPCNDFSIVGESKGMKGKFGPLYKYGSEYISKANPLFFFAENVSGLTSANAGEAFDRIQRDLAGAGRYGYELTTHLYKFEDYGVPQTRHRIVIIGMRSDLGIKFHVPKPSGRLLTCREAIEVPPIPDNATNNELTAQSPRVVERLSHIKPGENAWTAKMPQRLRLNVDGAQLSQIYKRLDPERPAYTVTGSGGGGTHVYHWSENRALTNRERARLQTFPDDFFFVGSKESVRRQIGMAVPPRAATVILNAVLKSLLSISYPSIEPSFGNGHKPKLHKGHRVR